MRKYVNNHLRFVRGFRIDFTNNLAKKRIKKNERKIKSNGNIQKFRICEVVLWSNKYNKHNNKAEYEYRKK